MSPRVKASASLFVGRVLAGIPSALIVILGWTFFAGGKIAVGNETVEKVRVLERQHAEQKEMLGRIDERVKAIHEKIGNQDPVLAAIKALREDLARRPR